MVNMMGFQSMAMLFHGKPKDLTMCFHWNASNHGFRVSLSCYFLWISMVFPWAFYGFVPVVFSFRALVVRRF